VLKKKVIREAAFYSKKKNNNNNKEINRSNKYIAENDNSNETVVSSHAKYKAAKTTYT